MAKRPDTLTDESVEAEALDRRLRCSLHPRAGCLYDRRLDALICARCGEVTINAEQAAAQRVPKEAIDLAVQIGKDRLAETFSNSLCEQVLRLADTVARDSGEPEKFTNPLVAHVLLVLAADFANRCGIRRAAFDRISARLVAE